MTTCSRTAVLQGVAVTAPVTVETLEQFRARIDAQLDTHFAKFRPVVDAINAGFAAGNASREAGRG
jgi:hypothetical protein